MNRLKTVTVYSFHTFEEGVERPRLADFKATREMVRTAGGRVAEGTAETVEATKLDESGRYRRRATGWCERR
jgi:hypothetical protein